MKKAIRTLLCLSAVFAVSIFSSCSSSSDDTPTPTVPLAYAVDATNNLKIFSLATFGTPTSKPILLLQPGETILGMDIRPSNGQLYALGTTGRIYTIDTTTGNATMVGAGPLAISGTDFGFDFNPVVDRIRIVSNSGMNIRVNPIDGLLVGTGDTALNPGTPNVTAVAYLNSFVGATLTTLYDIDSTTDMLYMQNPPNNGTLVPVGPLGINATASNGFDIGGTTNTAYAIFTVGGITGLYTINTTTGAATLVATSPITSLKGLALGLDF
ncbi:MAG: DUF4394 domain-containing protein [Bacteroidota bacterium]